MSCREFEETVWIYSELTVQQKRVVDDHRERCSQCQAVWEDWFALTTITSNWRKAEPIPKHASQLTRVIMTSVASDKKSRKLPVIWIDTINTIWLRYTMACLTGLLVVSFFYEEPSLEYTLPMDPGPYSSDIQLNSAAFLDQELKNKNEVKFSLLAYIQNQDCPFVLNEKKKYYGSR